MKRIKFSIKISHDAPKGPRHQPTVSRLTTVVVNNTGGSLSHGVGSLPVAGVAAHQPSYHLAVAYVMLTRPRVLFASLPPGRCPTFVLVNVIINEWLLSSTPLHPFSIPRTKAFRHLSHFATRSQRALQLIAFANVAINFKSAFTSFRVDVSPHRPLWCHTSSSNCCRCYFFFFCQR